jgi:hypothetical protein
MVDGGARQVAQQVTGRQQVGGEQLLFATQPQPGENPSASRNAPACSTDAPAMMLAGTGQAGPAAPAAASMPAPASAGPQSRPTPP